MGIERYAVRYCEIGLALTYTPPGERGPRHAGWNAPERAYTKPSDARRYWNNHPDHGIAALLSLSKLVSLDVDDIERSRRVLHHFGVNLDELRSAAPCIVGMHFRLMYKAPPIELKHKTIKWPEQKDPKRSFVLFELRAGLIADMLPPSIHQLTGRPYTWETPPRNGFPKLPGRLLEIWQDKDLLFAARALCPWAPPPPAPRRARSARVMTSESVIQQFNDAHDVTAILEAYGYRRQGKRFASPGTHHAAGISLLDDGKVYCHHAGDPLHCEHALDCFDVFRLLEHDGDYRSAVRAAAEALGIDRDTKRT